MRAGIAIWYCCMLRSARGITTCTILSNWFQRQCIELPVEIALIALVVPMVSTTPFARIWWICSNGFTFVFVKLVVIAVLACVGIIVVAVAIPLLLLVVLTFLLSLLAS